MPNLDKIYLRQSLRSQTNLLDAQQKLDLSKLVISKLLELEQFKKATTVMSYISMNEEVDTRDFLQSCILMGKILCVPHIDLTDRGIMHAVQITDIESQLKVGSYGILEPKDISKKVEPSQIDLIIVPGIAFDMGKRRLGRGTGYYDRYLGDILPTTVKCALCFDHQIIEKVPVEDHDKCMDIIITPTRTIY